MILCSHVNHTHPLLILVCFPLRFQNKSSRVVTKVFEQTPEKHGILQIILARPLKFQFSLESEIGIQVRGESCRGDLPAPQRRRSECSCVTGGLSFRAHPRSRAAGTRDVATCKQPNSPAQTDRKHKRRRVRSNRHLQWGEGSQTG